MSLNQSQIILIFVRRAGVTGRDGWADGRAEGGSGWGTGTVYTFGGLMASNSSSIKVEIYIFVMACARWR